MTNVWNGIKRILSEPKPIRFCLSRLLFYSGINLPVTLTFNKVPLVKTRLHASSAAHKLFIGKYGAELDRAVFSHFIKEDSTVIDVGANIGLFSSLAGKLASNGRVFAVEATPQTFQFLVDTLDVNKATNVTPIYGAVMDKSKLFYVHDHQYSKEQNFVSDISEEGVAIPGFRLDDLMQVYGLDGVSFLKVDVEGAELPVLRSLGSRIDSVECIYFECLPETYRRYDYSFADLHQFLTTAGYSLYSPNLVENVLQFKVVTNPDELGGLANNLIATLHKLED